METKAVTAGGWGKVDTEMIEMPSSTKENPVYVEIKKRKLAPLVRMNMIPSHLLGKVMKGQADDDYNEEETADMLAMTIKISEFMIRSVVCPVIINSGIPEEGEIHIEDIPQEDLEFLMKYVLGNEGAEEMEPFRPGAKRNRPGSTVQKIQPKTIKRNGSRPRSGHSTSV